jgi:hypothetical protein
MCNYIGLNNKGVRNVHVSYMQEGGHNCLQHFAILPEDFRIAATIKVICQPFNQGFRMFRLFSKHAPAITMIMLSMAATDLSAQDLNREQKALADTQARITALHNEQNAAAAQLKKLKAERAGIEKSLEPSTQEFEAAKAERDAAVADAKANPSDTSKKIADNANFKFMLAERKYDKAREALVAHDAKATELEKRIASNEAAIKSSQNAIEQQKAGLDQLQKQSAEKAKLAASAAAQKKEQELQQNKAALAETQAKAAAAQAEVERLKKMLADKQAQEAAAKATSGAAPVAAATVAAGVTAATAASVSAPAAAPAKAEAAKPAQDFKAIHADFLQRQESTPKTSMRGASSKIVYIKAMAAGKEVSKLALSLAPLTPNLYQGTAPLAAGDYDIVMGLQTWKQTIGAADGGKKFLVNVDMKSGKPELVMYPEDAVK